MTVATNSLTNALGTASPDFPAGMPTVGGDPIVESGSNSDGEWVRFADGTQIVTKLYELAVSSGATWTYPVPFPTVATDISISLAAGEVGLTSHSGVTSTSHNLNIYDLAGANKNSSLRTSATGRWK